jgi:membrane fusion protein (multidrug efflux system)
VRIELEAKELAEHPLRVGLTMAAEVDTHDQSGTSVALATNHGPVASTTVFDELDKAADERVNTIVSANLGHKVQLKRAG